MASEAISEYLVLINFGGSTPPDPPSVHVLMHAPSLVPPPQPQVPSTTSANSLPCVENVLTLGLMIIPCKTYFMLFILVVFTYREVFLQRKFQIYSTCHAIFPPRDITTSRCSLQSSNLTQAA